MKLLPCLLLLAGLASCNAASNQRVPLPPQDVAVSSPELARIYCVREEYAGMFASEIKFVDGSKEIGELTTGTFLCWERPAGRTLGHATYQALAPSLGNLDGLVDLDCKAGNVYYFNIVVRRQDGKPEIEPLTAEKGRELVAQRSWAGKK